MDFLSTCWCSVRISVFAICINILAINPLAADEVTKNVSIGWASCVEGCVKKSTVKPTRNEDLLGGPYTPNPLARTSNGDYFYPLDYPFLDNLILTQTYTNYYKARVAGASAVSYKDSKYVYDFTWNRDDKHLVEFRLPFPNAMPIEGGVFVSARSLSSKKRAQYKAKYKHEFTSIYGKTGRRIHGGIDYGAKKGQEIYSPITGIVAGFVYLPSYKGTDGKTLDFKGVAIRHETGVLARCLYITPTVKPGAEVRAGETKIGILRNLREASSLRGAKNHVHCDFTDTHCRRFDPYANTYVEPTDYRLCTKSVYVMKKVTPPPD